MDLVEKKIGKGGLLDLEIKEGKLIMVVSFLEGPTDVSLKAVVDSEYFCDKLAELIPGKLDDAVLNILKGALKGL